MGMAIGSLLVHCLVPHNDETDANDGFSPVIRSMTCRVVRRRGCRPRL